MAKTEFIVLCASVVGGSNTPMTIEYSFNGKRFEDRETAINHGFTLRRSDDFNIGVVTDGVLTSLDWMHETVDANPYVLAPIAYSVGLKAPARPARDGIEAQRGLNDTFPGDMIDG